MSFAFFGSSEFSTYVLDELKLHGLIPSLIITTPDRPVGRKLLLTPNVVKVWAMENNIQTIDPASLKKDNGELIADLKSRNFDLFLVASYGKMIPQEIFEIPPRKTLNIHPSLLPKYRGASPIQSQILNDEREVGVSIMQIEETMDTGPVLIQKKLDFMEAIGRIELERVLAAEGARLFAHILPEWIVGAIDPVLQNEEEASYCTKIEKEDGELMIDPQDLPQGDEAKKAFLKILAFEGWPGTYFTHHNKRVVIKEAHLENGVLQLTKVLPEGKREMSFSDFLRGLSQ